MVSEERSYPSVLGRKNKNTGAFKPKLNTESIYVLCRKSQIILRNPSWSIYYLDNQCTLKQEFVYLLMMNSMYNSKSHHYVITIWTVCTAVWGRVNHQKWRRRGNMPAASDKYQRVSYIFCSDAAGMTWHTPWRKQTQCLLSFGRLFFAKVLVDWVR